MSDDRFLSVAQASTLVGSTPKALYRKIERGQLPYRKWGKRVLFKQSELLMFLDQLPGMKPEDVKRRWNM